MKKRAEGAVDAARNIEDQVPDAEVLDAEKGQACFVAVRDDTRFPVIAELSVTHRGGAFHLIDVLRRRLGCGHRRPEPATSTLR